MLDKNTKIIKNSKGNFEVTEIYTENHFSGYYSSLRKEVYSLDNQGKKNGTYVIYLDGSMAIGTMVNGKKDGNSYTFSSDGKLSQVTVFDKGEITKDYGRGDIEFAKYEKTCNHKREEAKNILESVSEEASNKGKGNNFSLDALKKLFKRGRGN